MDSSFIDTVTKPHMFYVVFCVSQKMLSTSKYRATHELFIHLSGYENQRAWVPLAHVLEFNGLSAFETLGKIKLREAGRNSESELMTCLFDLFLVTAENCPRHLEYVLIHIF